MNVDEVLSHFRHELRTVVRKGESLEALPGVTRRTYVNGAIHEVTAHNLEVDTVDDAIRREVARAACLGVPLEWKVFSFDSPPDLLNRLRTAGFTIGDRETMLAYDTHDGLSPFTGPEQRVVRKVDSRRHLEDFRRVAEEVFLKDYSLTTREIADALRAGDGGITAYVAYDGKTPVSVARLYTDPKSWFAGLYGGGTVSSHRGRGFYRAMVAARSYDAVARGARYLIVDALPTSLPILLRLGFVRVADTWPCGYATAEAILGQEMATSQRTDLDRRASEGRLRGSR
ncbi:MAG: hypothetical protein KIS66_16895 [Fimbriimonadaceae bacterium]|nr:hypothetical protein [Fimbriimonadaceae bacterium]